MSRDLAPCGTAAAYRRHLRRGEPTCPACRSAQAADIATYRDRPASPPRELIPCGSEAAYRRHLRRSEVPCRPCVDAHSRDVAKFRRRRQRQVAS